MAKKKILCFTTGPQGNNYGVVALCEDGRVVGQHICTEPRFFEGDIGITTTSHHEDYDRFCGVDNWSLRWVDDPIHDEDVKAAIAENAKLFPQSITTNNGPVTQEPDQKAAYLTDDISVGELVRFINAACVHASRNGDKEQTNVLAHLGGQIDYALSLYRKAKQG